MPSVAAGRAVARERPLGRLRSRAHAPHRPSRPRDLLGAHPRRARHRLSCATSCAAYKELPCALLPDPDEVPRRDPPTLRPLARPRVHHEGRLQLPRQPGVAAEDLRRHERCLRAASAERLGLDYRPVEADSGQIGGSVTCEFMALAEAGEAELVPLHVRIRGQHGSRRLPGAPHRARRARNAEDSHARRAYHRRAGGIPGHSRIVHREGARRQKRCGRTGGAVHSRRPRAQRAEGRPCRGRRPRCSPTKRWKRTACPRAPWVR